MQSIPTNGRLTSGPLQQGWTDCQSQVSGAAAIVLLGSCLTLGNNMMSYTFHAYQQELFPTGIRARAVGLAYSWSRFSALSSRSRTELPAYNSITTSSPSAT